MRLMIYSALAASVMIAGCVSVLPEPTTPDALYRVETQTKLDGLSSDLVVREPEAPRLIAGQGMVSEGADGGLRLIPGVEWSGNATRQIQLAMIDNFDVGKEHNAMLPEFGVSASFELATHLKTLHVQGDTARCVMTVSLINSRYRNLTRSKEVRSTQVADSNSSRDRALALQAAASDCAAQAAAFSIEALTRDD